MANYRTQKARQMPQTEVGPYARGALRGFTAGLSDYLGPALASGMSYLAPQGSRPMTLAEAREAEVLKREAERQQYPGVTLAEVAGALASPVRSLPAQIAAGGLAGYNEGGLTGAATGAALAGTIGAGVRGIRPLSPPPAPTIRGGVGALDDVSRMGIQDAERSALEKVRNQYRMYGETLQTPPIPLEEALYAASKPYREFGEELYKTGFGRPESYQRIPGMPQQNILDLSRMPPSYQARVKEAEKAYNEAAREVDNLRVLSPEQLRNMGQKKIDKITNKFVLQKRLYEDQMRGFLEAGYGLPASAPSAAGLVAEGLGRAGAAQIGQMVPEQESMFDLYNRIMK